MARLPFLMPFHALLVLVAGKIPDEVVIQFAFTGQHRAVISSEPMSRPCWPGEPFSAFMSWGLGQVWRWTFSTHGDCCLPSRFTMAAGHPCVTPALWSPPQLTVIIFQKLQSFVLSSACKEKYQNQLDLTLREQRSLSAMMHLRKDNSLPFLFLSPSSIPLSFCRVGGCYISVLD